MQCIFGLTHGPTRRWRNGDAQCCQLSNIADPLATFFPSKKRPNLIQSLRIAGTAARARGLALPAHAHLSLSLSLSLSQRARGSSSDRDSERERETRDPSPLPPRLSRYLSSFLPPISTLIFSLSLSLFSLWRLLSFCSARSREEQRFNSVKHRYYVASLILHAKVLMGRVSVTISY